MFSFGIAWLSFGSPGSKGGFYYRRGLRHGRCRHGFFRVVESHLYHSYQIFTLNNEKPYELELVLSWEGEAMRKRLN